MPNPVSDQRNINLATVENCNLLCKLIMDYIDTDKCKIERIGSSSNYSFRIVYPEGSFINYRDTSYELTYAYFFYPSRHSIDGQKYDLEINIYHGKFASGDKGMVAHTHYHNDTSSSPRFHKHFHYHLSDDTNNESHDINNEVNHVEKNIVTCLLYNKGIHDGSDLNIFFNQFVHHPKFKGIKNAGSEQTIKVHDHWSIEQLYPKKRSFFIYDEESGGVTNTYVVFDTVQTISKEIIDRLYVRGIKSASGFDISGQSTFNPESPDRVMYRKNIEVITDPAYKKTKRAQIKDLLSLTRMSTYKPTERTVREYSVIADNIINSYTNGDNVGFYENEVKAKDISNNWDFYGRDNGKEVSIDDTSLTPENLQLDSDIVKRYNYVNNIYKFTGFNSSISSLYLKTENFDDYLKKRRALSKLFTIWFNWDDDSNDFSRTGNTKNVSIIGSETITHGNLHNSDFLFSRMYAFFKIILLKFLVSESDDHINNNLASGIDTIDANNTDVLNKARYLAWNNFCTLVSQINTWINKSQFISYAEVNFDSTDTNDIGLDGDLTIEISRQNFWNHASITDPAGGDTTSGYAKFYRKEAVKALYKPAESGYYKEKMSENNIRTFDDVKEFFETLNEGCDLLELLANQDDMQKALNLRVLFEDLDTKWQQQNNVSSNMYETIKSLDNTNRESLKTKENLLTNCRTILNNDPSLFTDDAIFIFIKLGGELERTISNEECQPWLSNQVHYEGDLWKFWKKNRQIASNEAFDWSKLTYIEKDKIRDGLLRFDEETSKWKTHNKCRNPGNRAAAPWCYTKNPNKRWEYCKNPVYTDKLGRIMLLLVFIFLGVIAFYTIKTLFLHEYPMKFVAKITGGNMASQESFGAGKGAAPAAPK